MVLRHGPLASSPGRSRSLKLVCTVTPALALSVAARGGDRQGLGLRGRGGGLANQTVAPAGQAGEGASCATARTRTWYLQLESALRNAAWSFILRRQRSLDNPSVNLAGLVGILSQAAWLWCTDNTRRKGNGLEFR